MPGVRGIHCPECDRYVGPVETCPYCRARVHKRRAHISLKYGAVVIAIVGILVVRQLGLCQGTPRLDICDVGPENNFAHVELTGTVINTPMFFKQEYGSSGSLYFEIDDGTDTITVRTYPSTTPELLEQNKVPGFGDRVRVKGQVAVTGDAYALILQTAAQLTIYRAEPVNVSVMDIASADSDSFTDGNRVRVVGELDEWLQYTWALSLWLEDENGKRVNIWIPQSITDLTGLGVLGRLDRGMTLMVEGGLKWYESGRYSRWEVTPATSQDIREVRA